MTAAGGGAGGGQLPEELARFVAALQSAVGEHHGPECRVCPVCQLIGLLRSVRPEAVEDVVVAAAELVRAVRVAMPWPAGAAPGGQDETGQDAGQGRDAGQGQGGEHGGSPGAAPGVVAGLLSAWAAAAARGGGPTAAHEEGTTAAREAGPGAKPAPGAGPAVAQAWPFEDPAADPASTGDRSRTRPAVQRIEIGE